MTDPQHYTARDSARRVAHRGPDRRVARRPRLVERRTGFDRRRRYPVLGVLRDNAGLLIASLVLLNLLSLADWGFTLKALELGAIEGNPVLASLISTSPALAIGMKTAVILAVSLAIWSCRRYRLVLATAVGALFIYTTLIAYHIGGLSLAFAAVN